MTKKLGTIMVIFLTCSACSDWKAVSTEINASYFAGKIQAQGVAFVNQKNGSIMCNMKLDNISQDINADVSVWIFDNKGYKIYTSSNIRISDDKNRVAQFIKHKQSAVLFQENKNVELIWDVPQHQLELAKSVVIFLQ